MKRPARVAFFTAGTTGAGHLVKGYTIQRGLERAGFTGQYRVFGPPLPFPKAAKLNYSPLEIVPRDQMKASSACKSPLAKALESYAPDLLLVDLFWAPLKHILNEKRYESWLLLRSAPDRWLVGPPALPFDHTQFRRIIAVEPELQLPFLTDEIPPMACANPDERAPSGALREWLLHPPGRPLRVSLQAGIRGECRTLAAQEDDIYLLDFYDENALFPAARYLHDADLVLASGGYNSVWEAKWMGYLSKARLTPFSRPIDDQAWRISLAQRVQIRQNGADVLAGQILSFLNADGDQRRAKRP